MPDAPLDSSDGVDRRPVPAWPPSPAVLVAPSATVEGRCWSFERPAVVLSGSDGRSWPPVVASATREWRCSTDAVREIIDIVAASCSIPRNLGFSCRCFVVLLADPFDRDRGLTLRTGGVVVRTASVPPFVAAPMALDLESHISLLLLNI
jgi:hypothetical protein